MVQVEIRHEDIRLADVDLIALKYADAWRGVEGNVAEAMGFEKALDKGEAKFVKGDGIKANEAVFVGVGSSVEYRYEQVQEFASQVIVLARNRPRGVRTVALTLQGLRSGLDVEQAFLSLLAGIATELRRDTGSLEQITIVELSERRCTLLRSLLSEQAQAFGLGTSKGSAGVAQVQNPPRVSGASSSIANFGRLVDAKDKLFVAMPFADSWTDEFEIGFREASKASNYVCERLDLEVFVGDIVVEIKKRIIGSVGVIALLNDNNPNVFLEVGFAFAHEKPTILVAKAGSKLPFDVSGQRCVMYKSISDLRSKLTTEIAELKAQGVLSGGV